MSRVIFLTDLTCGRAAVEGLTARAARHLLGPLLGDPHPVNCGLPRAVPPAASGRLSGDGSPLVRVHRIYHGSLVDGPGRRSVLQVQGCSLGCVGCYAGSTHDAGGGQLWDATSVAETLLDPAGAPRDGVTILGGEPAQQPEGVRAVVVALRRRDPRLHLTLYSGYTIEELQARPEPAVRHLLDAADLLIDGRYVHALAGGAGEWRGSRNQRVIDLPATRRHGGPILWQPD